MKNKNLENKKNIGVAQELDENNLGAVSGGSKGYDAKKIKSSKSSNKGSKKIY